MLYTTLTAIGTPANRLWNENYYNNEGDDQHMPQGKTKKIFHYPCSVWNPYNKIIKDGIEMQGLDVVLIEGKKAAASKGEEQPGLGERLKQLATQAGVVHFHWIGSMTVGKGPGETVFKTFFFIVLLLAFRLRGIKLVITLHNLLPHDKGHERVQKLSRRIVLKFFNAVVLHSSSALKQADKMFGIGEKSVVIPHPNYRGYYPDHVTREEARKYFELDLEQNVILFFGILRPYKQIDTLLSMLMSPTYDKNFVLIIGGMNKMGNDLFKDMPDRNIIVHDRFIPDEEVQYYFRCADCLVLPTSSPSALTSGAAALSVTFQTPIIARDYTPFQEFFEKGLGVPSDFGSSSNLNAAVQKILSWNRAEFEERCLKYNLEANMERVGEMHAQLYRQVAGKTLDHL